MKRFEGREIQRVSVAVSNAGDGLSKALGVEPQELHIGQTVYVVIETEVTAITHRRIMIDGEPTNTVERVAKLRSGTATTVDPELVKGLLDEQRRKIEAAAGVLSFPTTAEQEGETGDD